MVASMSSKLRQSARAIFLKMFHLSAPFYFLWLDYHILRAASIVVMTLWDRVGFPIVMLGLHLFTVWGQVLQQAYFFIVAWKEVTSSSRTNECYRSVESVDYMKHVYFPSVVVPTSVAVSLNFWILYSLDPLLLDDLEVTEKFIPPWLNQSIHTYITVIALLETVFNPQLVFLENGCNRAAPKIFVIYVAVCMALAAACPRCVYPLMKDWPAWRQLLFLAVNCAVAVTVYEAAKRLHRTIWGEESASSRRASASKQT